jgi:hypothetical protein
MIGKTVGAEGIAQKGDSAEKCILSKMESNLREAPARLLLPGL